MGGPEQELNRSNRTTIESVFVAHEVAFCTADATTNEATSGSI
jgi:hypothetical protein